MDNPFKDLDKLEEEEGIKAPPSIKNKVLGSYGFMLSIGKVVEFIFGSFTNMLGGMLRLFEEPPPSSPNFQNEIRTFGSFMNESDDNDKDEKEADGNKNDDGDDNEEEASRDENESDDDSDDNENENIDKK